MVSLYDYAGGEAALHRLGSHLYASVLADPVLQPLSDGGLLSS